MKKILTTLILTLTFAGHVLADGPIVPMTPYMQGLLKSANAAQAQSTLGLAGGTNGVALNVVSNTAIAALAPALGSLASSSSSMIALATQPDLFQNLAVWLNARQQLAIDPNLTDGQTVAVTNLTGLYPVGNNAFGSASVQFSSGGANGRPGFLFPESNAEIVISNAFKGVQTCTIAVTFKDNDSMNNEQSSIVCGGGFENGPWNFFISPWIDAPKDGQVTGGTVGYFSNGYGEGPGTTSIGVMQAPGLTHVLIWNFDGSNLWTYLDGQLTMDSRLQPSTSSAGLLNTATNAYVSGGISGSAMFHGVISDFRLYTNVLSPSLCNALMADLDSQAGLPVNTIVISGDSISVGLHTTVVLGSPSQFAGETFPDWLVNTIGYSGRTVEEDYTNLQRWLLAPRPAGRRILCDYIGVNDFGTGGGMSGISQSNEVPVALGWLTNSVTLLVSNNITPIIPTLMSCFNETNSIVSIGYDWRSNYNATVRTFTNLGAVIWDCAAVPSLGTNGAYKDSCFVDQLHPTALGYTNMWQVLLPLLRQQIYGVPNVFTNSSINLPAGSQIFVAGNPMLATTTNAGSLYPTYLGGAGNSSSANQSGRSIGIGLQALSSATNDSGSVAIGTDALQNELGGSYNIAIGWGAMAFQAAPVGADVAIGLSALSLSNADLNGGNVAIGYQSLIALTNGDTVTAIGNHAGGSLQDGSGDIYLGDFAGGDGTPAAESGVIRIGNPAFINYATIAGTNLYLQALTASNGICSYATGGIPMGSTGITNTTGKEMRIFGLQGANVWLTNTITGVKVPLGSIANASAGSQFILQPGEALIGSSMASFTNLAF